MNHTMPNTGIFGLYFVGDRMGLAPVSFALCEMTQKYDHYAVQGHSFGTNGKPLRDFLLVNVEVN